MTSNITANGVGNGRIAGSVLAILLLTIVILWVVIPEARSQPQWNEGDWECNDWKEIDRWDIYFVEDLEEEFSNWVSGDMKRFSFEDIHCAKFHDDIPSYCDVDGYCFKVECNDSSSYWDFIDTTFGYGDGSCVILRNDTTGCKYFELDVVTSECVRQTRNRWIHE